MAIYRPPENAEKIEKKPEQEQLVQAIKPKTYTQEEVLAMIEQIQRGKEE